MLEALPSSKCEQVSIQGFLKAFVVLVHPQAMVVKTIKGKKLIQK